MDAAANTPDPPLGGLLVPQLADPTPMVTVPVVGTDALRRRLTLVGADTDQAAHVTADSLFVSATGGPLSDSDGNGPAVYTFGPALWARATVKELPSPAEGVNFNWGALVQAGLTIAQGFSGEEDLTLMPDDEDVLFSVQASPTAVHLATVKTPGAQRLNALGFGSGAVGCILKAGGAAILSTMFNNRAALANGVPAFLQALRNNLGQASVDIITKVGACV